MKYIFLTLIIALFSGCAFEKTQPTNYFTIEPQNKYLATKQYENSLFIQKPTVNAPYNAKSIVYSQSPYSYKFYSVNKWVDFPDLIVNNLLYNTIEKSKLFNYVSLNNTNQKSSFILKTKVTKLLHKFKENNSFAIVNVQFELFKKNELIKTVTFEEETLCEENSPYGFVKATNKIFGSISNELLELLENSI